MKNGVAGVQELYEEGLNVVHECGDQDLQGLLLLDLGSFHYNRPSYLQSRTYYQEAYKVPEATDEVINRTMSLVDQSSMYSALGENERMRQLINDVMAICQTIGSLYGIARCERSLAQIPVEQGRYDEVRSLLSSAKEKFENIGSRNQPVLALQDLCMIDMLQGQFDTAEQNCKQAISGFEEENLSSGVVDGKTLLGGVYVRAGRTQEARPMLYESLARYKRLLQPLDVAVYTRLIGETGRVEGNLTEARRTIEDVHVGLLTDRMSCGSAGIRRIARRCKVNPQPNRIRTANPRIVRMAGKAEVLSPKSGEYDLILDKTLLATTEHRLGVSEVTCDDLALSNA